MTFKIGSNYTVAFKLGDGNTSNVTTTQITKVNHILYPLNSYCSNIFYGVHKTQNEKNNVC